MVGMPGVLARFLTRFLVRFLARFLTRVFGSENTVYRSTGTEKYSFTGLPGQRNTVLQFDRDRKIQFDSSTGAEKDKRKTMYQKSHVIKYPIY